MILSDRDIKKELKAGKIVVKPFRKEALQPASVDLRLDKSFLVYKKHQNSIIDPKNLSSDIIEKVVISKDKPFILHPGEFCLGVTLEETGVGDNVVGRLDGKSSLARLGLIIHTTAGYLDPGNSLKMTLELYNAGSLPIKLYYKMPIAQMVFEYMSSPCLRPYGSKGLNSKYFGSKDVQFSKMDLNFKNKKK